MCSDAHSIALKKAFDNKHDIQSKTIKAFKYQDVTTVISDGDGDSCDLYLHGFLIACETAYIFN